jgi:hypothetical protein
MPRPLGLGSNHWDKIISIETEAAIYDHGDYDPKNGYSKDRGVRIHTVGIADDGDGNKVSLAFEFVGSGVDWLRQHLRWLTGSTNQSAYQEYSTK